MTTLDAGAAGVHAPDHLLETDHTSDLFALLLARRGWSAEYLAQIENSEHDALLDLDKGVAALHDAHTRGTKITIAPDFDMDGIASGVLGYAGLSELGFNVALHLPDYRRGHDLTIHDIAEINRDHSDTGMLLTCDSAINSHAGLEAARSLGWQTLVTDHHQELEPGCNADIVINPCRMDETYTNRGICGAHVLHQLLSAYAAAHAPEKTWEIHLLSLLSGLGTVSDVMPLVLENRQLVRNSVSIAQMLWTTPPQVVPEGGRWSVPAPELMEVDKSTMLQLLATEEHHPVFVRAMTGFAILLKAFAMAGKLRSITDIDEAFYGFFLAPAMNSPRRTEEPLAPCFEVFLGKSESQQLAAAHEVIAGNERRKEAVTHHMQELQDQQQPLAPYVYLSRAPGGMLGLLANQLMQAHEHPVVVVTMPESTAAATSGSARAPMWFDVIATLDLHEGLMGIGHRQACGVRVDSARLLADLANILAEATVAQQQMDSYTDDGRIGDLVLGQSPQCDAPLDPTEPLIALVERVEALHPFGHGFTQPRIELMLDLAGLSVRTIGTDSQHLRLTTHMGMTVLWWNSAEENHQLVLDAIARANDPADLQAPTILRVLTKLETNTFRGHTRLQAMIERIIEGL